MLKNTTVDMLEKLAMSIEDFANELDKQDKEQQIKTAETASNYGSLDSRTSAGTDAISAWLFSSN